MVRGLWRAEVLTVDGPGCTIALNARGARSSYAAVVLGHPVTPGQQVIAGTIDDTDRLVVIGLEHEHELPAHGHTLEEVPHAHPAPSSFRLAAAVPGISPLTNAVLPIPGTRLELDLEADVVALVWGVFDFDRTDSNLTTIAVGALEVDDVVQVGSAIFNTDADRATVAQDWRVPLAAGAHALELSAQRAAGTGAVTLQATHTSMMVLLV